MKLVVTAFMTLDGVVQAPGGPDEDPTGGFTHGGWAAPHFSDDMFAAILRMVDDLGVLLLGRRTYEIFAAHWPYLGDDDPIAAKFNRIPKYVASRTLESLDWRGSHLLGADIVSGIQRLKQSPGAELQVHGSGTLVQTLLRHGLKLWSFPVVLGEGLRLFAGGTVPVGLVLTESHVFDSGAVMHAYRMEGPVARGSFELETPTDAELRRRLKMKQEKR